MIQEPSVISAGSSSTQVSTSLIGAQILIDGQQEWANQNFSSPLIGEQYRRLKDVSDEHRSTMLGLFKQATMGDCLVEGELNRPTINKFRRASIHCQPANLVGLCRAREPKRAGEQATRRVAQIQRYGYI